MFIASPRPPSPPGPRPTPLLGARGNLIRFMRDPLGYMTTLHQRYGDVAALARDSTDFIFVFTPDYNRQVLADTTLFFNLGAESSPLRIPRNSSLSRLLGGLAQMNGEEHRLHRAMIAPALHRKYIEASYQEMASVAERTLSRWSIGERRDLFKDMKELTLTIAVKTLVGLDLGAESDSMCRLLEKWVGLVFSLAAILVPLDLPGLPYRQLTAASDELERIIRRLIEVKRRSEAGQDDVLSRLMLARDQEGRRLTDAELIGQTNFLFMAGHATTAAALTWSLFLLSQHPDVQNAVSDELDERHVDGIPTWEQLAELRFLEAVVKESLRLLPPVLWWSRVATGAFALGHYELPRGTRVVHSAYITHRNECRFQQPRRFLPHRWLSAAPGPFEYVPFSAGPRMCLGSTLAMIELKLVIAMIVRRYHLAVPDGHRVDIRGPMLCEPKHGLPVIIEPHHHPAARTEVGGTIREVVDLT